MSTVWHGLMYVWLAYWFVTMVRSSRLAWTEGTAYMRSLMEDAEGRQGYDPAILEAIKYRYAARLQAMHETYPYMEPAVARMHAEVILADLYYSLQRRYA